MTAESSVADRDPVTANQPAARDSRSPASWFTRFTRQAVNHGLSGMRRGTLTVRDHFETRTFGGRDPGLNVEIAVQSPRLYQRLVSHGSLGFAESYLDREWETDDLVGVIRFFLQNRDDMLQIDRGISRVGQFLARLWHSRRANTKSGSQQNIRAHYDLSNEFFQLFLDDTLMYSSAIFPHESASLREASLTKLDRICRKLQLRAGDRVIEIGTGWGGFAEFAAKNYGCHVTTTTISPAQFQYARERIERAGLRHRVTLLQQDYRDLTGEFDKLVSIEMIEAVGHRFLNRFFQQCGRLLRPDGLMALQAIVMPEQRYDEYLRSVDFIQKYIFPGGCLPTVLSMQQSLANQTDLRSVHLEDFSPDYALTLAHWRERFHAKTAEIRALGFDDRFFRTWHYYFCYCEAAFRERAVGLVQLVAAKPACRVEPRFGMDSL